MEMNISDMLAPWDEVHDALGLGSPIRDAAHHNEMLRFVDECFEQFGADDDHPIFVLVNLVALRIRKYEDRMHPWPDAGTPQSRLPFLMGQHGLRQCDLPKVGAQSVVSAVLAGKRGLNLRQARALAQRFQVSIEALIG